MGSRGRGDPFPDFFEGESIDAVSLVGDEKMDFVGLSVTSCAEGAWPKMCAITDGEDGTSIRKLDRFDVTLSILV